MKLQEIISSNNWLSIELIFVRLYPDQKKNLDAYKEIYFHLKRMEAVDSEMQIVLHQCYDEETNEKDFVEVYGVAKNESDEKKAIEFVPWTEWKDMTINEKTLDEFNELEIISHCLYEMTFYGYDENEIQKQFSELKKQIEEIENMTEEGKKKNFISWEDVLKELDKEDE